MQKSFLFSIVALFAGAVAASAGDTNILSTSEATFAANVEGAINSKAVFSVSATQKVYFSKGNLQYQPSSKTWRFAAEQYETIGNKASNLQPSSTQTDWVDFFNWGFTGYMKDPAAYTGYPTDKSSNPITNIENTNYDWGVYCAIQNGGNEQGQWRTLTQDEWSYLLSRSKKTRGIKITEDGSNTVIATGVAVLPDEYSTLPDKTITLSVWKTFEAEGCLFLPSLTGHRNGSTSIQGSGYTSWYWVAKCSGSLMCEPYLELGTNSSSPYYSKSFSYQYTNNCGCLVRLVQDKK